MRVCIFFFLRISSIWSLLVQIYELILFFRGFCDVTEDNIPGELRMFSILFLFSSEHFVSCLVCTCIKQRFCWAAHPVRGCFVCLLTFGLKFNVTWE